MSVSDYVIDILLIAVVVLQLRPRPQTWQSMLRPIVLVAVAGVMYLRGFPVGGNDLALIAALTAAGIVIGAASGWATAMWRDSDGTVIAQAGLGAAALWVAGMGLRFVFAVYANSDSGAAAVARFSLRHDITSAQVWTTALVLMAFGEVFARVAYLQIRRHRLAANTNTRALEFAG